MSRAEGVFLYTEDGRKIIDAISSWWVNLHGHANPRIAAAIAEQARKLEHVILAGFTHDAAEELAERLRKWIPPQLTHMFFSDDGSTAVEVALKWRCSILEISGGPRNARLWRWHMAITAIPRARCR